MSIIQIADNDYKCVSINNDDTENIKRFANKKIKFFLKKCCNYDNGHV